MRVWEWMRGAPLREVVLCLGAALAVAVIALVRLVVAFWQRAAREEPVLRCIRELRWDRAWPAAAYRERLAKRLHALLGIGARRYAARSGDQVDLSFDYQGTTWFIAIQDRSENLQRKGVERDIADLVVECIERRVKRPTVAVVVGVPSGTSNDNLQLRALRAAFVCGKSRPAIPASSDLNFEIVSVPLARTSAPPGASANA
jgi:hypothetical protein